MSSCPEPNPVILLHSEGASFTDNLDLQTPLNLLCERGLPTRAGHQPNHQCDRFLEQCIGLTPRAKFTQS
jgi:hypothetical protein